MTSRRDKTGDPTYTQSWDYDNKLVSVAGNGQTTTYTYDGNGVLLKKVVGSTTTIYVGNYYEKTGSVIRKYYYFAGQRVAMRDGSTVYYLVTDHLGSTSKTLTSSGGVFAELRYKPYGEIRYTYGTTPTNYRFTGQLHDSYINLYAMGARQYDPALGRWISPDTIVPGTATSSGGGAATLGYDEQVRLTPLTVGFHEMQFLSVIAEENREVAAAGFWFQRSEEEKGKSKNQWGPLNPQALNRYAYCLGNPLCVA